MRYLRAVSCTLVLLLCVVPAWGLVHLWRVKEIFSNPDGTIQFIELAVCCGSTTENSLAIRQVTSDTNIFVIPTNVAGSTLNKHLLLATARFAMLPGAPTPDHIIPDQFFSTTGDTITFSIYDTLTFTVGMLPTDGTTSLNKDPDDNTDTTFTAINSPTNYSDQTGSVVAVSGAPAVPDGSKGSIPVTVAPLNSDASMLEISFDVNTCLNAADHHIVSGYGSGLPTAPGGTFTLLGSVCGIGTGAPYTWVNVPEVNDVANLLWFILVATDDSFIEGSWGTDSFGAERHGPGNSGSSGICAVLKSLSNTCGSP